MIFSIVSIINPAIPVIPVTKSLFREINAIAIGPAPFIVPCKILEGKTEFDLLRNNKHIGDRSIQKIIMNTIPIFGCIG